MPLNSEDRKSLRVLLIVAGGFVLGVVYLMYVIATDL